MLQAGIETRLTLRQADIFPKSYHHSKRKWRNFLHMIFYIYVIGYLEYLILTKNY